VRAEIIIPLDNYISRGNDVFLANPDYLKMVLAMYQKVSAVILISSLFSYLCSYFMPLWYKTFEESSFVCSPTSAIAAHR
jgi:hypothetical protein